MSDDGVNGGGHATMDGPAQSAGTLAVRDPSTTSLGHLQPPHLFPTGASEAAQLGVDYLRVYHSLRRRWLPATLLGLALATVAAVAVWCLMPRGYEAVAWLRVRGKGGMLQGGGRDGAEYESYKKTQLALLRSTLVLQGALRKPGIDELEMLREAGPEVISWLSKSLLVTAPAESEVVQVRLRGPKPDEVAKVVNAVVTSFLDDIVNKERTERLGRRDALEKKFKENMAELRTRRETVNNLARTLGTRDSSEVATQRGLLLDHLGALRQLINNTERSIAEIDSELSIAEARNSGEIPADDNIRPEMIEAALARDPQIAELTARLADLEEAISFQSQRSARGTNDPSVRRLRAQAEEVEGRLQVQRRIARPAIVAQFDNGGRVLSPMVLKKRRDLLAKTLDDASREYDQLTKEVTELGKANADLDQRKNELDHLQRVTDQIGIELESSAIDLNAPNRVSLIEPASVPQGSDSMMRILLTLLAAISGFSLAGGAVLALDYLRDCVNEPDEVTRRLGVRVLGTFPLLAKISNQSDYGAVMAECGDTIRTLICQSGRQVPKVILVTSAVEHEGKTTFAAQLAASLARADKRTLLVDGDLRHPHAHLALDLELRVGLPELLRGELANDEVVQPTTIDGLFAVTGGECDYAAITALARPEFTKVIAGFRESFDHVVIDAGPVLAFADSLLLAQQSDAVILATMIDVSRIPQVGNAIDRLRSVGARLLGVVVNGGVKPSARRGYAATLPA